MPGIDNLMSCTLTTDNRVIKWDGFSSSELVNFGSIGTDPRGVTYDGLDAYVAVDSSNSIKWHDGFTSATKGNIVSPGSGPNGLSHDKKDLFSSDQFSALLYQHDGFSTTIKSSIASPAALPECLSIVKGDTYVATRGDFLGQLIWHLQGFTTNVLGSIVAPGTRISGVTSDGKYFYSCDRNTRTYYKHDGFTTTILDSYAHPGGKQPTDVEWENIDARLGLGFTQKLVMM